MARTENADDAEELAEKISKRDDVSVAPSTIERKLEKTKGTDIDMNEAAEKIAEAEAQESEKTVFDLYGIGVIRGIRLLKGMESMDGPQDIDILAKADIEEIRNIDMISDGIAKVVNEHAKELENKKQSTAKAVAESTNTDKKEIEGALGALGAAGVAPSEAEDALREMYSDSSNLLDIERVDPRIAYYLIDGGYDSVLEVAEATESELEDVPYVGSRIAPKIHQDAERMSSTQVNQNLDLSFDRKLVEEPISSDKDMLSDVNTGETIFIAGIEEGTDSNSPNLVLATAEAEVTYSITGDRRVEIRTVTRKEKIPPHEGILSAFSKLTNQFEDIHSRDIRDAIEEGIERAINVIPENSLAERISRPDVVGHRHNASLNEHTSRPSDDTRLSAAPIKEAPAIGQEVIAVTVSESRDEEIIARHYINIVMGVVDPDAPAGINVQNTELSADLRAVEEHLLPTLELLARSGADLETVLRWLEEVAGERVD